MSKFTKTIGRASAAALFMSATLAAGGAAWAADATGTWARPSGSSQIRISSCGKALCGKLVWLKEPRKDTENPDPKLRARPLLGVRTVYDMTPDGDNAWKGKVYNAEDGKTYTGKMVLNGGNKLKLSGCVLGGLICKGETWTRVK